MNKINVYRNDGAECIIKITNNNNDDLIMIADSASEHYDWVLNIEKILLKTISLVYWLTILTRIIPTLF